MQKSSICYFKNLDFSNLICAVSTKAIGDISPGKTGKTNLHKFCRELKIDDRSIVQVEQIHKDKIRNVTKKDRGRLIKGADGLITKEAGVYLMIRSADCFPILFFDPKFKIAGAVHAGWRGTASKIVDKMVDKFQKLGSNPAKLRVVIGPGVCQKHYKVGKEVKKAFINQDSIAKNHLDLLKANLTQLQAKGLKSKNIQTLQICTYENQNFYSYRKNKTSKRFATVIGYR